MNREIGPLRALANGLLCLGILGAAGYGAFQVAGRNWQVQDTYAIRAEFANVGGLEPGARVYVQGVDAGVVEAIAPPEAPGSAVGLVLRVDARLRPLIRTDAEARIATRGVVGARVLELTPGSPDAPVLPDGSLVASAEPVELDDLIREAAEAMDHVDAVADSAERGLGEITAIAAAIRKGEGTIGRLVMDDEPIDKLVRLTSRGERTLTDLQDNLDAIKNTWPFSRYFERRGYDDRDLVLYRPNASRSSRVVAESDLFEPGRAVLTEAGRAILDEVARWSKEQVHRETEVVVAAYTDSGLEDDMAEVLTQRQAEAVRRYLIDTHNLGTAGWFRSRTVAAVGFGTHRPRTPHAEPQGDLPGRRVEIILFTPQA